MKRISLPIIYEISDKDFGKWSALMDESVAEKYCYGMKATWFLIKVLEYNRLFVITAKHNFEKQIEETSKQNVIDSVRFLYHVDSREFLPIRNVHFVNGQCKDREYHDICIFEVEDKDIITQELKCGNYYSICNLESFAKNSNVDKDSAVYVNGHPTQAISVDTEELKLKIRDITISGTISKYDNTEWIHEITWQKESISSVEEHIKECFSFEGMSGSPVFSKQGDKFLGMLITAGRDVGRFIDGGIIFQAVKKVINSG